MIELRVLTADDWAVWRELRLAALAEAPYAFGSRLAQWQGDGDAEPRWRARLSIPGSYNVVAVLDGELAGMASGVPAPGAGAVELISMWVRPEARGRAVGDCLVWAVEWWARQVGATVLHLAVAEGNVRAASLYRRHEFQHTGECHLMPDGVRREHLMAKVLAGG